MNFFILFIDGLVEFIRRNPLLCLLIFMLALFAPSVLGGIAMVVLYLILGVVVFFGVLLLALRWRLYRLQRHAEKASGEGFGAGGARSQEGEVRIFRTRSSTRKRVSGEVGDYVEFEEIDQTEKK